MACDRDRFADEGRLRVPRCFYGEPSLCIARPFALGPGDTQRCCLQLCVPRAQAAARKALGIAIINNYIKSDAAKQVRCFFASQGATVGCCRTPGALAPIFRGV
jgi:hypothetical protein